MTKLKKIKNKLFPNDDDGFKVAMTLIMMLILFTLIGLGAYSFYKQVEFNKNDCLIEIAQDFCEQNGMRYERINSWLDSQFSCRFSIFLQGEQKCRT